MPWEDYGWEDLPSTDTPLTSANLNAFGQHIYDLIVQGGGGLPTDTPQNLFVGPTAPEVGDLLLDSLWVKTVDGEAAPIDEWQVYSGTGDGNGVNLIIQEAEPEPPAVDALWIPLNPDGSPKYLDEWVVYTGRGSVAGVGNPNLFIQPTLPASPPEGSFLIPLTGDTPRSIDQWRTYMAEWNTITVPDATPRFANISEDEDLGVGQYDGHPGIVMVGEGEDVTIEEFLWDSTNSRWLGTNEHLVITSDDAWALDMSRQPASAFENAWCRFNGGVGWEKSGPRSALRSGVSLPAATIDILDVVGGDLAEAGQVYIRDQIVTYTGWDDTEGAQQLTGCTGGTGTYPANTTPVIPYGQETGGDPGGWGTTAFPLDHVGEMWSAGFRLQEAMNAWVNGSVDLRAMQVGAFYLNYDIGDDVPNIWAQTSPPSGSLGPGITVTGPPYDKANFTTPGSHDRREERGFEMQRADYQAWSASAPTKRILEPRIYGRMAAGAADNGETYGVTLRLRWILVP